MKYFLLLPLMAFAIHAQAQFGGSGSGTASDPYLITNEDELFDVRNDLSANYKLMADLDLTEWIAEESPKDGWNPIGNSTTPFRGVFNGNLHTIKGLYINRPNTDNVGLFGEIYQSTIMGIALVNPIIYGRQNVGAIVGAVCALNTSARYDNATSSLLNNAVVGGIVSGTMYVGGITGKSYKKLGKSPSTTTISGNYSSSNIYGSTYCGGIIGFTHVERDLYNNSYNSYSFASYIRDNRYDGNIVASGEKIGGILGNLNGLPSYELYNIFSMNRNVVCGNIIGNKTVGGIFGTWESYASGWGYLDYVTFENNVCCADTIACGNSIPYRITPFFDNENNYGCINTVLVYNGDIIETEDNNFNGVSYGARTLRRKTTYQGMGFDFDSQWAISELKSYPYNIKQSTPPELTSFTLGDASMVKGTADGSGKLYVFVGDEMYEGVVTDGQWQMSLGYVDASKRVTVSVQTGNLMPSPMLVVQKGDAAELPTGEIEGVYLPRNISTFCSNKSLDYSQTEGIRAYIAAGYNKGTVMLMRAKYVPAGEGVILMGEPGSYNVYTTSTKVYYSNMLKGVLEPTVIDPTDGDKTNFILTNGSTGIGFYAVSNSGELAAGKAYLQLPTDAFAQSGKAVNFVFDDQTTGIFNTTVEDVNDGYYTLDGVRLDTRPTDKGIYIHNGKKIVITK